MTNATLGRIICGLWLSFLLAACVSPAPRGVGPSATGEPTNTARAPRPTFTSTQTPTPSATPTETPTATPTVEPTILSADEQFGPPLQDALKAAGVTTIDCALPDAAFWEVLVKGGVMQQVKFLDQSFLNLVKRFMQADGTIILPDAVTTFHCGFRPREDGVMEAAMVPCD